MFYTMVERTLYGIAMAPDNAHVISDGNDSVECCERGCSGRRKRGRNGRKDVGRLGVGVGSRDTSHGAWMYGMLCAKVFRRVDV